MQGIVLVVLLLIVVFFVLLFIWDKYQAEHAILRNYPIIGHFRYWFENLGVYLRQYWFASDREELPFNRATRSWVYRAAKNVNNMVGFGSTRDLKPVGTIFFVDAPFPVLEKDSVSSPKIRIGPYCEHPYDAPSFFNISGMSYGALSKNAVLALSRGAKRANCWMNTGEGGVSPYHLEGGADLVAQIGTAKYGFRDKSGNFCHSRLREIAAHSQIKMFEIKLSQGAKPGKGGVLPAVKVNEEIAKIRGIHPHQDSISPNRHPDIASVAELLAHVNEIRNVTGKPVGFKLVLGNYYWLPALCEAIREGGLESAPDFITLDGAEGGTGAAPMGLTDYVGLPIHESLPILVDHLVEYGLKERIKVIAGGKLVTPAEVAWAIAVGADFVVSARGFLLALGCIQSMRCHLNTCPTGITTHNPRLVKGLDVKNKAVRVEHYVRNMHFEVGAICHSCGVAQPRELKREHTRIVTETGISKQMSDLYPDRIPGER